MAYQALYRKWRPLSFQDVVGQKHVTDTLKTELLSKRFAHAYLFCGTRGTGKTTTAQILSRALNCEQLLPSGDPCNQCPTCKGVLNGSILDVIEIDAASNNGVDNIRDLRDEISYTPANAQYKVYIIDEVHMLSTGAFNALLKTLEEPPAHVVFILATTEPHKIPATIQSRCQRFDFRRISLNHIAGLVGEIARKDGIDITPDAIRLVAELGDGSMRDALSVLDLCAGVQGQITRTHIEDLAGVTGRGMLFDIATAVANGDISTAISLVNQTINLGRDGANLCDELLQFYRELLICKLVQNPAVVLDQSEDALAKSMQLVAAIPSEKLLHAIRTLGDTVVACKYAANPQILLEAALVKLCVPATDATSEAFAARIANLEAAVATGSAPLKPVAPPVAPMADVPSTPAPVEAPPFDLEPPPVEPPPVIPVITEQSQPNPSPEPQQPTVQGEVDYPAVAKQLQRTNPPVGALLAGTSLRQHEDTAYIIFETEMLRDTAKAVPTFLETLQKALGVGTVKLVTEKQEQEQPQQRDPLDDLLALGDRLEQITIF